MKHVGVLRAMGALRRAPELEPLVPVRLSDQTGDAITAHLVATKLWRDDVDLGLERDGARLTIRAFLPEHNQSDRDFGRVEAIRVRAAISQALTLDHHAVRFVDSFWQERGRKGWVVLVKTREP